MSLISSRKILVFGRFRVSPLTHASTTRTWPSGPGYVCSMRLASHCYRTIPGSITTTTSPTCKLSLRKYLLCLDPICGKNSFIHRLHPCLVKPWTLLQHFRRLNGSVSTLSGTKSPPICPIRKWFGVKTRSPLGSSLTPVKGLEFNRPSPPGQIVYNCSSLTSASLVTTKIARFANLIIGSKGLPKCGGAGGFHFQLIPLLEIIRCILSWSIAATRPCSSLDALKFVLCPVNPTNALRNVSMSKDDAISKWQQWGFEQRNKHK